MPRGLSTFVGRGFTPPSLGAINTPLKTRSPQNAQPLLATKTRNHSKLHSPTARRATRLLPPHLAFQIIPQMPPHLFQRRTIILQPANQQRPLQRRYNQLPQRFRIHSRLDLAPRNPFLRRLRQPRHPSAQRSACARPQYRIPIVRLDRRIHQRAAPRHQPRPNIDKVVDHLLQPLHRIRRLVHAFQPPLHRFLPRVVERLARQLFLARKVPVYPALLQPRHPHQVRQRRPLKPLLVEQRRRLLHNLPPRLFALRHLLPPLASTRAHPPRSRLGNVMYGRSTAAPHVRKL